MWPVVAFAALAGCALEVPAPAQPSLRVTPSRIVLQGPYAESRALVESRGPSGRAEDAGSRVQLSVADPRIATVDEWGTVRPVRDGRTRLIARLGKVRIEAPIEVSGMAQPIPPRFVSEVIPVLTRLGCNQGACHGAAQGKGGFRLSLLGYDPELDYQQIRLASRGRRANPAAPEKSLLLQKPTLGVPHRGGKRLAAGSPEYRLLRDWIAAKLPPPNSKEPEVLRLEPTPPSRTLRIGQSQRFRVLARFTDGSARDVTSAVLFSPSDETVAIVSADGEARAVGQGEAVVILRYRSVVATARIISPFGRPRKSAGGANPIDRLVEAKLAALGLDVSPRCSDAEFVRRAYLDLLGILPTPAEAYTFAASRQPDRRERLIDSLLERPEYVDFWAMKWADLFRSNRTLMTEKGMLALNAWIRRCVLENRPWDAMAREILLAQGSTQDGPAAFYRAATTPETRAETVSQAFLGVRIQCARCHNHPYEKWTQNQYHQFAAFFARVRSRNHRGAGEQFVFPARSGEVTHPRTGRQVQPCALDGEPLPANYSGDRREELAAWLTSPENPFFARALVNRVWKHLMGRGLVEPVDDLRATNPSTNEELFSWLADDFARNGYDVRRLIRQIMRTETYQRSSLPRGNNRRDTKYAARYPFKRLGAEQLMDVIAQATGVPEKFAGLPPGTRAAQIPDSAVPSYFLELFGRPARATTCECERTEDPNLGQVLHLMNNAGLNSRIADRNGRVARLISAGVTNERLLEELYLAAYSRLPDEGERRRGLAALAAAKERRQAAEDLLWALMNSKEFVFNH